MTPATRRGLVYTTGLLLALGSAALLRSNSAEVQLPPPATALAWPAEPVATFSIVGFDPETGDLGIAVQSKFFAVGSVVPWARAGIGAVATQSYANTAYGNDGLDLLADGLDPDAAIARLTAADPGRDQRQVGLVDARGRAATFTGDACLAWAGGRTGTNFAAQGNILAGAAVVDAMADTFVAAEGDLASRLLAALAAGQAAGGDARGRQSAALLVVRAGGGYDASSDRYVDLRVDDHATPIRELARLLDMRHGQLRAADAAAALRNGDHDEALRAARHALELDPNNGSYYFALARVLLARGELDAAGAAGSEALRRDPWLKTAALRGLLDTALIERLLQVDEFARRWEAIETDG